MSKDIKVHQIPLKANDKPKHPLNTDPIMQEAYDRIVEGINEEIEIYFKELLKEENSSIGELTEEQIEECRLIFKANIINNIINNTIPLKLEEETISLFNIILAKQMKNLIEKEASNYLLV